MSVAWQEIERRAYEIWEREGRAHGRDAEHWAAAEAELGVSTRGEDSLDSPVPKPAAGQASADPAAKPVIPPLSPANAASTLPNQDTSLGPDDDLSVGSASADEESRTGD